MPLFYWWDSTYILVILAALISLGVSAAMNATFQRYQGVRAYSGLTGAQTAQRDSAVGGDL